MKTIQELSKAERTILEELRLQMQQEFPHWVFRMTIFGSRARGDAEPDSDSDMDILIEIETEQISFVEKQRLRRVAGEISINTGTVLSLLIVDRSLRRERGDFSIFHNIREEGIPV